jgi:hypothetical protein
MGYLFLGAVRWLVRHLLSLLLILTVLLCGKWLHTKWDEAVAAREQQRQLQAARPAIGNELLKAAQALEQHLRLGATTDAGVKQLQAAIAASVKIKQDERDQLKKDNPLAVSIPTTAEFKRVAVLDMELAMFEHAKAQTQALATFAMDVADGKRQVDTLKLQKYQADKDVYGNRYEDWQIRQQHPVASHVPGTWPHDRLQTLASVVLPS